MSARLREHSGLDYVNISVMSHKTTRLCIVWADIFNEQGHNAILDMGVYVLQFAKGHPDSAGSLFHRIDLEQTWICRIRTKIPDGPNVFNNKKSDNIKGK